MNPTLSVVGPSWPYPGENMYYPAGSTDPVRPNMPYTPVYNVPATGSPSLPVWGVVVAAAVLLLLEHLRRRRGR